MFKMSYGLMLGGLVCTFLAFFLGFLLPIIILWLIVWGMGAVLIFASLFRVHLDALDSTLYYLMEEPQRGTVNWLFVRHDGEIEVLPAVRKIEKFSQNVKLDQQIKEWKTYRFAGHTVRIVGDGTGFSIDLGACAKVRQLKREYGIRNIFHIRNVFRPHLKELDTEDASWLSDAQVEAGMKPILPGGAPK